MDSTNILYGKKWAVCGDSFTNGDFSGGYSETFENGPFAGKYKTYGYLIAERNQMTVFGSRWPDNGDAACSRHFFQFIFQWNL